MHQDIFQAARSAATQQGAGDRQARNRAYHLGRAQDERAVAAATADPAARSLHLQLADLHDAAARAAEAKAA